MELKLIYLLALAFPFLLATVDAAPTGTDGTVQCSGYSFFFFCVGRLVRINSGNSRAINPANINFFPNGTNINGTLFTNEATERTGTLFSNTSTYADTRPWTMPELESTWMKGTEVSMLTALSTPVSHPACTTSIDSGLGFIPRPTVLSTMAPLSGPTAYLFHLPGYSPSVFTAHVLSTVPSSSAFIPPNGTRHFYGTNLLLPTSISEPDRLPENTVLFETAAPSEPAASKTAVLSETMLISEITPLHGNTVLFETAVPSEPVASKTAVLSEATLLSEIALPLETTPLSESTATSTTATLSEITAVSESATLLETVPLSETMLPSESPDLSQSIVRIEKTATTESVALSRPTSFSSGASRSGHANGLQYKTGTSATFALTNWRGNNDMWAYIFGQDSDWKFVFANPADPATFFHPEVNPDGSNTRIANADIGFRLGSYDEKIEITIPSYLAGGRIYISQGPMEFYASGNPSTGAKGVTTPASNNPHDPNHPIDYTFLEFTWNADNIVINLSAVDLVGLPVGLDVENSVGGSNHVVKGMKSTAVRDVCNGLIAQSARDGSDWKSGCIFAPGKSEPIRAISPKQLIGGPDNLFAGYLDDLNREVYDRYARSPLYINFHGDLIPCRVRDGTFHCEGATHTYEPPSLGDFFGCGAAGGTFKIAGGNDGVISPVLCAAWNRGTLLLPEHPTATLWDGSRCAGHVQPCVPPSAYYPPDGVYNHWSRIVHENEWESFGYAFAYDDNDSPNGEGIFGGHRAGVVVMHQPGLVGITVGGYDLAPGGGW